MVEDWVIEEEGFENEEILFKERIWWDLCGINGFIYGLNNMFEVSFEYLSCLEEILKLVSIKWIENFQKFNNTTKMNYV